MRKREPAYLSVPGRYITSLLLLLLLSACGGGGGNNAPVTQPVGANDEVLSLADSGGTLSFPKDSLPAGTTVTVREATPPPATEQLTAVGRAFQIDIDTQPDKPVKVTLPIPAGEDPNTLMVSRFEDSGRITLLQTQVEGGMLVALTPGFSRISAVRLEELPEDFRPGIFGPEVLPVDIAGQYSEQTLSAVAGVESQWRLIEDVPHELIHNSRTGTVNLSVEQAGLYTLMVEFTEPTTGLNVAAFKSISILATLEAGNALDVTAYGPAIIDEGEPFNLSAVVLNTDVTEISRWSWTLGNKRGGSCESDCSIRFDLNNQVLNEPGTIPFSVTAESASGLSGSATMNIKVLSNRLRITRLSHSPNDKNMVTTADTPPIQITATAEIEGGTPPYTYKWFLNDAVDGWANSDTAHIVWDNSDDYDFALDQPGHYKYKVEVSDSENKTVWSYGYLTLLGAPPISFGYEGLPTASISTDQPLSVTLTARGGVLAFNGYQYESYDYLIDWGDGTVTSGKMPASNPFDGGRVSLSHPYTSPSTYTLQYTASPTRSADFLNFNFSPFEKATVEIVAPSTELARPTDAVCPTTIKTTSDYDEDYRFLNLTHDDLNSTDTRAKSTCNYALGSGTDLAAKIYINYGAEIAFGCDATPGTGRFEMISDNVLYDRYGRNTAWSTQRTLSANYVGVGSSPLFDDGKSVLIDLINAAVAQSLGETCP